MLLSSVGLRSQSHCIAPASTSYVNCDVAQRWLIPAAACGLRQHNQRVPLTFRRHGILSCVSSSGSASSERAQPETLSSTSGRSSDHFLDVSSYESIDTLDRLDFLLGTISMDEEADSPGPASTSGPTGSAAVSADQQAALAAVPHHAPKVSPFYVYVIYYVYILVFVIHAYLQYTQGSFASEFLEDKLINDHASVLSGEVTRLATAGFFCDGPYQLFLNLAALGSLGAELESLMGYSIFWALYWLTSMTGNLVDTLLSEQPVTYGPANSVAGMVGAFVAYMVLNQGLDEQLRAASKKMREQIFGASSLAAGEELVDGEVTIFMGFKLREQLSVRARGALLVLVATVEGLQGMYDIASSYPSSSWYGMAASFWAGIALGGLTGPVYQVRYTEPGTADGHAELAERDNVFEPQLTSSSNSFTHDMHDNGTGGESATSASSAAGRGGTTAAAGSGGPEAAGRDGKVARGSAVGDVGGRAEAQGAVRPPGSLPSFRLVDRTDNVQRTRVYAAFFLGFGFAVGTTLYTFGNGVI